MFYSYYCRYQLIIGTVHLIHLTHLLLVSVSAYGNTMFSAGVPQKFSTWAQVFVGLHQYKYSGKKQLLDVSNIVSKDDSSAAVVSVSN